MSRYKVFLQSGTVITIEAYKFQVHQGWLTFYSNEESIKLANGDVIEYVVAQFAPDMWEGYQYLTPASKRKADNSGS